MQNGQISWTGLIWKTLSLKNAPLRCAWLLLLTLLSLLMFFIIVAKKKNGEGTCTDISLNSLTVLTVVLITLFSFYAYSSVRSLLHWTDVFQSFIREIWRAFFCPIQAKERGYSFFGIQFYGECWSGSASQSTYAKHGLSKRCTTAAPYVGKDHANFVYMLTEG